MPKTDDFLATLHVLAAGDAPTEQLQQAVQAVFTRFVQEAETPLGNQSAVVGLQDALTAAMVVRANSARFEALRTCAHELTIEWLRGH
jgi:HD-like signal output (HDOD) protein